MRNSFRNIDSESRGAGFLALIALPEPGAPRNEGTLDDDACRALAQSLWVDAINDTRSLFARLEFLAGLRNFKTGEYEHYGLELCMGRAAASELARRTHVQVFAAWLRLDLAQEVADLSVYLSSRPGIRRYALQDWRKANRLLRLVPEAASVEERAFFLVDVELVAELLAADYEPGTDKASVFNQALLQSSEGPAGG